MTGRQSTDNNDANITIFLNMACLLSTDHDTSHVYVGRSGLLSDTVLPLWLAR